MSPDVTIYISYNISVPVKRSDQTGITVSPETRKGSTVFVPKPNYVAAAVKDPRLNLGHRLEKSLTDKLKAEEGEPVPKSPRFN